MIVSKVSPKTLPLCYLPDGRLVCYSQGRDIVLLDGCEIVRYPFPVSNKEKILGWNRIATRLFRFGIRSAIALNNEFLILSKGSMLYEMDIKNGCLSKGWHCGAGIRPLIFTDVKGIEGFADGIYFGGYLVNPDKKNVNIYKRVDVDKWEIVYTFEQGAINHVHNVVPDPFRKCIWIFTGDFDESAAIWKATDNFKKVECVACNDQKYRGCVVFALPEGLLYATDAPFADDFIYLLNPESMMIKEISPIHGSGIYGCQWKDKYVFSSTVEGDGRNEGLFTSLFNRKRGAGIKDNYVHLYVGNLTEGFKEIYKEKKDFLPFIFQFGAFRFPTGYNNTNKLYFQPVATSHNDLSTMCISI